MGTETDTEDQPVATNSDEVTHAEYAAWEKGEEHEAETVEAPAEEPAEEEAPEEPASEEPSEPAAPAEEDEDDGALSRGLKKRLDKIRQREADAHAWAAEEGRLRAAAEARAAAAEALLAARGEADAEIPPDPRITASGKERVYTQADLAAEATKIAAQQVATDNFNRRCNEVADVGEKEFGSKWAESLESLTDVGALAAGQTFLQDALDTDAPAKVLHHLGQNPDEAERLLALSPTRRAVALDRLAVQLTAEKPKVPKPISKVPAPIAPVGSGRSAKEIDINDPGLSDEEAFAAFERLDRQRAMG